MDEEEEDEHVFCRGKRSKPMKTEYWPATFVLLFSLIGLMCSNLMTTISRCVFHSQKIDINIHVIINSRHRPFHSSGP